MPREVTAYLCAFRCGSRAIARLKSAEAHEAKCARNPARRACKTCAHNVAQTYSCEVDALPAHVAMAFDCQSWTATAPQQAQAGQGA